ncbi:hypothetical protein IWQ60_000110 [Tieghemiomyces parasiticus]|uniref:Uncharacterized protein n=1 Tax=Tieghemiomyces parasiticus TaxID=78921 RepID=A0A9W8DXV5_9FUNG|nr:hypothetical protein IWQ60_000110 [Tieghemiomyces parasiticus]
MSAPALPVHSLRGSSALALNLDKTPALEPHQYDASAKDTAVYDCNPNPSPATSELSRTVSATSSPSLSPTCSLHELSATTSPTSSERTPVLPDSPASLATVANEPVSHKSLASPSSTPSPPRRSLSPEQWQAEFIRIVGHPPPHERAHSEVEQPHLPSLRVPEYPVRPSRLGAHHQPSPLTRSSPALADNVHPEEEAEVQTEGDERCVGKPSQEDSQASGTVVGVGPPSLSVSSLPSFQGTSGLVAASIPAAAKPRPDKRLDYIPFEYSTVTTKRSSFRNAYTMRSTHVGTPEEEFPLLFLAPSPAPRLPIPRSSSFSSLRGTLLPPARPAPEPTQSLYSLPDRRRSSLRDLKPSAPEVPPPSTTLPMANPDHAPLQPNFRLVMTFPEAVNTSSLTGSQDQPVHNSYLSGYLRKRAGKVQYFLGTLFLNEQWILKGNSKIAVGRAQMRLAEELAAKAQSERLDCHPEPNHRSGQSMSSLALATNPAAQG